jgi:hypothetical protein
MQEQMDIYGLAIDQVPFLVELRQNLATNKADYGKMIRETEAFSPEGSYFKRNFN